ncbi:sigma-70 family RNA polymerase sigma factor [Streptomyces sp. NPDC006602]|uniref:sigma-70 family RNA polymerase sigma factor n=1 Tax=Streptomyces sp. NPDC006602 TaxID=3364751 RepID=UPI0036A245D5
MNDGPTATYARLYEEQQPRLVAYARSLTKNSWTAEDLVAEAHFRVWRRLSAGHEIDNVPAYLMTTVRHLASAAGSAVRETPRDPQVPEQAQRGVPRDDPVDPAEQVSSVDLLVRVLGQLPERWVKALWLAEAEGQPLAAVGAQIGSNQGATAVLLHRAREGMRQAFLQVQTGAPDDPACQVHWARMPAYVRGTATSRQSERLLGHVDTCDDCRGRLAVLIHANNRLPALVGPALLVFVLGGAGKFLLPFAAGSAGAVVTAGGQGGGLLHGIRDVVTGGSKAAVGAGAAVAGIAVALLISLGAIDSSPGPGPAPSERVPVAKAPATRGPVAKAPVPVAEAPVAQPPQSPASEAGEEGASAAQVEFAEAPVTETPQAKTPAAETPVTETPATDAPKAEPPAAPSPVPEPDPVTPTPADPQPVRDHPAPPATDEPAKPTKPAEPAPVSPAPQPTPSDPGDDCGD